VGRVEGGSPVINLVVNGKSVEIGGPQGLPEYLESLGVADRRIAVAHNGSIVRKDEFVGVTLRDGDRLEIVRAIGGG